MDTKHYIVKAALQALDILGKRDYLAGKLRFVKQNA
jgi:hypothetical protein